MTAFDKADLARRRAIYEAATKGPFSVERREDLDFLGTYSYGIVREEHPQVVGVTFDHQQATAEADAIFFAHARTGYPGALAEIERRGEEIERLRGLLRDARDAGLRQRARAEGPSRT